jgi:N-acetylglucosaminyldiphosphoundecaprenol N-acetyl-beta-D-mannosaminyltransferase
VGRAVYFANAHTLELTRRDPTYGEVLRRADVLFGDGVGVRWAVRWLHGQALRDNVNGTDLLPLWMERSAGHRVFLLGTEAARVEAAAAHVAATWPHWQVVGAHHGFFAEEQERLVVEAIAEARPDVLLVGMGNPAQEVFIDRYRDALGARVCIGVGALLDYWSGAQRRAPRFLRERGLEWGYRMVFHRGKLGRYTAGSARFMLGVVRSKG